MARRRRPPFNVGNEQGRQELHFENHLPNFEGGAGSNHPYGSSVTPTISEYRRRRQKINVSA